ncbi:ATP11 protein-domain-containing protein [Lipomyces oligophaga]|uniref:ATP11 protein-domain-containing protein n=1 Tax=Lipomyces oligophaga TaxID=45792 RepID=UPI0034CF57F6
MIRNFFKIGLVKPSIQRSARRSIECSASTAARFYATQRPQSKDDIIQKYKDKLEEKMKKTGTSSIEDLREHYKAEINKLREDERAALSNISLNLSQPSPSQSVVTGLHGSAAQIPKVPKEKAIRTLSSYVDVDKLAMHDSLQEIELIWRARHARDPNSLCAVLSAETFNRIRSVAQQYPMFILPLPRDTGASADVIENPDGASEIQFVQWSFPERDTTHCILTSLLEYKLHTDFARPHTTLIFHSELAEKREIVLLNGTVEPDMSVTPADAQFLVAALQKFYNSDPREVTEGYAREKALRRRTMLELFKRGQEFEIKDLISEVHLID